MANSGLQTAGCVLGCVGGLCNLIATFLPEWKTNESSDLDAIVRFEGLWIKCVTYPSGLWQCESYDSFFIDLPRALQVGRALSCSSILFGFAAFIATLVGIECTSCFSMQGIIKSKVLLSAAFLWMASGALSGTSVTYYAYLVLREYRDEFSGEAVKYMYGPCLYLGWSALIASVAGSLLIGCGTKSRTQPNNQFVQEHSPHKTVVNQMAKPFLHTEYV